MEMRFLGTDLILFFFTIIGYSIYLMQKFYLLVFIAEIDFFYSNTKPYCYAIRKCLYRITAIVVDNSENPVIQN